MANLIDRQAALDALDTNNGILYDNPTLVASLHKLLSELPPAQQWIPCSSGRMPEVGQDVMISVGGMYSAEGCLRDDGDWYQFRWSAIIPNDRVTAWCELPEPYKGGYADGRP